ncbi:hypothetical protein [uncultured Gammaproteobacteria bacterium]|jgi:uncharacterized membrane protein YiaA|nr:hypothetical protein [thiotrophic endosymbiont of Bathymodiolus puteoserpentis (Logatchev)]CAC9488338.1 hypothetical protein [uncultured Gammaproteobacteria bacterium]CAC9488870.1 hypothetical protein [uncultured Gammaproteobacteria bacterium]CAC9592033.1 hypothetical protein [uncultured Gammaproteobacteria bacterium]CAC9593660.1 hypothetical protein [uncultured Gammaproteobacteria bacterium]CAC9595395.1 hypothetical protein [uncultured Gammaproteobacteria bacterium]
MKYLLISLLIIAISMIVVGMTNAIIAPILTGVGFIIIALILKK